jgi:hypothetical protein
MAADIIGSKMKDFPAVQKANRDNEKTGYGQNGYSGASSDTDLANPTRSALAASLPLVDLEGLKKAEGEKRPISDAPIAPAHGMKRQTK